MATVVCVSVVHTLHTECEQGFWTVINFLTDGLLLSAFAIRIAGIYMDETLSKRAQELHFKSFQVLSCVAPLIWIKLVSSLLLGKLEHELS